MNFHSKKNLLIEKTGVVYTQIKAENKKAAKLKFLHHIETKMRKIPNPKIR